MKGKITMKGKKITKVGLRLLVALLTAAVIVPAGALSAMADNARQDTAQADAVSRLYEAPLSGAVVDSGGTKLYNGKSQSIAEYDKLSDITSLPNDAWVSVSKTIEATDEENIFDITLDVRTKEAIIPTTGYTDVSVVLVLDYSTTMSSNFDAIIDGEYMYRKDALEIAAQNFIDEYASDSNARWLSIVTFNINGDLRLLNLDNQDGVKDGWINLNSGNSDSVKSEIPGYKTIEGTNIDDGFRIAQEQLAKNAIKDTKKFVILFTDGQPNNYGNPGSPVVETAASEAIRRATEIKAGGTELYAIGLGEGAETNFLKDSIASPGHYFKTKANSSDLVSIFEQIANTITVEGMPYVVTDIMGEYIYVLDKDNKVITSDTETMYSVSSDGKVHGSYDPVSRTITVDFTKFTKPAKTTGGVWENWYLYSFKYRVKLDNLSGYSPNKAGGPATDSNESAEMTYALSSDDPTDPPSIAVFPIPSVKGGIANLAFNKVDGGNKALANVVFTLTTTDNPDWEMSATSEATTGTVSFANIPSGHDYTLTETIPNGYSVKPDEEFYTVKVYNSVLTAFKENTNTSVNLNGGTVVNDSGNISLRVTKAWGRDSVPQPVTIELWARTAGTPATDVRMSSWSLNANNGWTHTFDNLQRTDAGNLITYYVKETGESGGIIVLNRANYSVSYYQDGQGNWTVTNTPYSVTPPQPPTNPPYYPPPPNNPTPTATPRPSASPSATPRPTATPTPSATPQPTDPPIEIPDTTPPLAETPDVEIPDDPPPLIDVPETGDTSDIILHTALLGVFTIGLVTVMFAIKRVVSRNRNKKKK
jgi:hypothetical protein